MAAATRKRSLSKRTHPDSPNCDMDNGAVATSGHGPRAPLAEIPIIPRDSHRAGRAVHHREESNDGTHETKPPELQRRRLGP